jgi:predicted ATPase/class 3 adenylate cyclase
MPTFTFVLTDIENSTHLWEMYPHTMGASLEQHDCLLKTAIESNGGDFVKSTGDGSLGVFSSTSQATRMAIDVQRSLALATWGETGPLQVRIGIHVGEAEKRQGDYFGATLNRTARLMALGHGGQVLCSNAVAELIQENQPEGINLVDLGEHRLKDLKRPEHIFQLVAEGIQLEFPPLRSLGFYPNNLPVQLTSFVGRESEIEQALEFLKKSRLVTLTGPGGTGKTRLSLQVAAEALDHYRDGTWLVELASLTEAEHIPQSIAKALILQNQPGRSLTDAIIDYFRYKTCLLILDNCEHLIEACALLAEKLLMACPGLTILASSRELLGIGGETVMRIPPLKVPDLISNDTPYDFDQICRVQAFDAVCLFVDRVKAVSPDFKLDASNVRAVIQICKRLDGIPLALELAAARVRLLTPSQIADHLDDRFRLLTGGSRTALPRQQTLLALIEWSWDLLSEQEKTLLRRLSVFSGGFNLEAVEAVCAYDLEDRWTLMDCLEDLVNKSLVSVAEDGNQVRYSMLETIRQFARERLRKSGEVLPVRDNHWDFFFQFAARESAGISTSEMVRSLDNLERDYENLRLALEWGIENRWSGVLELAASLVPFWESRPVERDASTWIQSVLEIVDQLPLDGDGTGPRKQAHQAYLLASMAYTQINMIEHAEAEKIAETACELARQAGDQRVLQYSLRILSLFSTLNQKLKKATDTIDHSIRIAKVIDDPYLLGRSLVIKAMSLGILSGDVEATALVELELNSLGQRTGNPWLIAMALYGQGMANHLKGDMSSARSSFEKGIEIFSRIKNPLWVNILRSNLGHLERQAGNVRRAAILYQQTLPRWLEMSDLSPAAHQFECLAYLCMQCNNYSLAAKLLGFAEMMRQQSRNPRMLDEEKDYVNAVLRLKTQIGEQHYQTELMAGKMQQVESALQFANGTFRLLLDQPCRS